MLPSVEAMIRQYVAAWNERNLEGFKAAFAQCWAEEATYTDPNFALIEGVNGIAGLANDSLEQIPIRRFNLLTMPDAHHHAGRYTWNVVLPEETKEGFDYFEFNQEYKITRMVSFFDPLNPIS